MSLPRPGEAEAFSAALAGAAKATIRLDELLSLWATAAPRLIGAPEQLACLATTLQAQADDGTIVLPVTSWERRSTPALPNFITVPAARRRAAPQPWRRFPWRGDLGWVSSERTMTTGQYEQMVAINDWLARTAGRDVSIVPHRFRSAEIFGNEKVLDDLAKTKMFGPGRVTYDLLSCTRYPSPLAAVSVGHGPDVLIVENSDPYWAAVEALRTRPPGPIGAVIWGSGKSFPSQVPTLAVDIAGTGPLRGTAWYWGDLDPTGVDIAVAASAGRPGTIRPASGLWSSLAACEPVEVGRHEWTEAGAAWLGADLWELFAPVREAHARVAQEAVPVGVIAAWAGAL